MFERPEVNLDIYEIPKELKQDYWDIFSKHHYLTKSIHKGARMWVAYLWGNPVAFNSVLPLPHGNLKQAWRGHRLVVLSDYQGMGIGSCLAEFAGELLISEGKRYFTKTANIKLGKFRNASPKWRPTGGNGKASKDTMSASLERKRKGISNAEENYDKSHIHRVCHCHEYLGDQT